MFEKRYDWIKENLPLFMMNMGGNIWLRKK